MNKGEGIFPWRRIGECREENAATFVWGRVWTCKGWQRRYGQALHNAKGLPCDMARVIGVQLLASRAALL